MSKVETKRINVDVAWWNDRLPPGWQLVAFTDRIQAQVIGPEKRLVQIDSEFMDHCVTWDYPPVRSRSGTGR